MYSINHDGNKNTNILSANTNRGIATDSFIFHDLPYIPDTNIPSRQSVDIFLRLMEKLYPCFEFVSMNKICRILRTNKDYYGLMPKHFRYPNVKGFVEMEYGPVLILLHHIILRMILTEDDDTCKLANDIARKMALLVDERNRLQGYYTKRLNLLKYHNSVPILLDDINRSKTRSIAFDFSFLDG